jgi:uncharacterized OB-fold protein
MRKRPKGWGCSACGWVYLPPGMIADRFKSREDIEAAFYLHKCERGPASKILIRDNIN